MAQCRSQELSSGNNGNMNANPSGKLSIGLGRVTELSAYLTVGLKSPVSRSHPSHVTGALPKFAQGQGVWSTSILAPLLKSGGALGHAAFGTNSSALSFLEAEV